MSDFGATNNPTGDLSGQLTDQQSLIKDGTTNAFMEDVIKASSTTPVIVDFWAPGCAPCAQLTPALEDAVKAAKGAVRLVKINTETNPELAAQFQIRSVPTVYAFKNGQPVDGFAGAMPESELKKFIAKLGGENPDLKQYIEQAEALLTAGDPEQAAAIYTQILNQDPEHPEAIGGMMKCYIESGDLQTATQALSMMPETISQHPAILSAKAALDLAEKAGSVGADSNLDEMISEVAQNPDDYEKRFNLAIAYNSNNRQNEAVDELITILKKQSEWNDGAAKTQLLEFFEAWGPKDPAAIQGRKKLSALLFA